ncbi:uncharacterized protein LOC143913346 isoform X2 [Arctopsyche grandis]|uniref:uncharacterized protein LOC143913346 isoform X2 n=1 Tax=Arctopsyche grandis TaxID=121162 RepID=UPI00406D796A
MGTLTTVSLVVAFFAVSYGWPRKARSDDFFTGGFIGEATNELSTAIIQSYVDDDSNMAFSPLGYSVILAILAEGAKGETRSQLTTALKLPEDNNVSRKMYQSIMERLKNTNEYKLNVPEFKNWFYVYKNYTINDDYRKVLEKYYLTEVRSVERYDSSFFEVSKESEKVEKAEKLEKIEQIDPLPSVEIKDAVVSDIKPSAKDNSKDVQNFDELQKDEPPKGENPVKKEVEVPKIVKEEPKKVEEEKIITFAMEDKPEKLASELYDKQDIKPGKNIKEKIKLANTFNKKTHEGGDYEIMEAVEARNHARTAKALSGKEGVTNSLSANRVGSSSESNSLMILFNGLYFRGSWKVPFSKADSDVFYRSTSEKKTVPMIKASGSFKTGSLPGLDSVAVELPYEGDRYALVIVKPRSRDGLRRLAADLAGLPPARLPALLQKKELNLKMPSFYVETTTKPLAALAKFGVSSIFSPEADLSGISPAKGLFVQEMVQHVSIKIDETHSLADQFSASNPSSYILERSQPLVEKKEVGNEKVEEFVVDHPFLYFVRDVIDNIIVVAGKVVDPEQMQDF